MSVDWIAYDPYDQENPARVILEGAEGEGMSRWAGFYEWATRDILLRRIERAMDVRPLADFEGWALLARHRRRRHR